MVVYDLICGEEHAFEGWFKSSLDFQTQQTKGLLSCPVCESKMIKKLPTASYISTKKDRRPVDIGEQQAKQKLASALKDFIVKNTDDVGADFVEEAKKIHYGEVGARNIRGVANKEEVAALLEEGVDILSLPVVLNEKKKLN